MIFVRNFKKVVFGYVEVEANNTIEAQDKFDSMDYDEFDNKSVYEWDDWECVPQNT